MRATIVCHSFSKDLTAFDVHVDAASDPPPYVLYYCILCHKAMYDTQQRECQTPYKCSVQPCNWLMHTSDTCKVCGRCPICISPKIFVGLQAFSYTFITFIKLDDSTSLRQKVTPPKQ